MPPAIRVLDGDMRNVVPTLDRIDAVVTDPPYHLIQNGLHLRSMQVDGRGNQLKPRPAGFMNQAWDGGDLAFQADTWWPVLNALKPGGHLVAFGSTRTFHRLVCAIEDAGFQIRDTLCWHFATGFPKSHNISAAIDRTLGAVRERLGRKDELGVIHSQGNARNTKHEGWARPWMDNPDADAHYVTVPATPEAAQWQGWGSALKPAMELICLARKPLEGTLAQNTLKHGVGGLHIDACRVSIPDGDQKSEGGPNAGSSGTKFFGNMATSGNNRDGLGRWPSNCLHDGSDEVLEAFAAYGERGGGYGKAGGKQEHAAFGGGMKNRGNEFGFGDTGSAARFFFSSKADKSDRADSKHPTVKPLDLMVWLTKLVCPPGGTVLDPFAGSGVTAEACMLNGFDCILVEQNPEYAKDIRHRLTRWSGGDLPLFTSAAE